MSRNFYDPWQNLKDVNGNDLIGRLTFYEANTSGAKKKIYDVDGKELANPIYTSTHGLLKHQVILDDEDYKVTFEQYIGSGNMESDENETNWFLYKTVTSLNGELTIKDASTAVPQSESINHLKAVKGMAHGDVRLVLGYYEAGDSGAPRYYVWRSQSSFDDDGGIVIKSNQTTVGAWMMIVPGTYIDVRWYGDLPDTSTNPTEQKSNLSQRAKAASGANWYHKDLYFPCNQNSNGNMGYYLFDGSNTVSVTKDIICDNYVRFIVKNGTSGTKVSCHELHKCDKYLFDHTSSEETSCDYTLEADWINTSWLISKAEATGARVGYVIDYLNAPMSFKDTKIKVKCTAINAAPTFDNCEIVECYKQISSSGSLRCTLKNMTFDYTWFNDDFDLNYLYMIDCTAKLQKCKDADQYIKIKNKCLDYNYGDLGEQELHNAELHVGGTVENCYGTAAIAANQSGTLEMHNASLTLSGLTASTKINAVDCWLTVSSTTNTCESISLMRGNLTCANKLQLLDTSYFDNVDLNTEIYAPTVSVTIKDSNINKKVSATTLILRNNKIYALVESMPTSSSVYFEIVGNTFVNSNAYHHVYGTADSSGNPLTKVVGKWMHNDALYDTKHWIVVDRENLLRDDSSHEYYYVGNAEPFIQKQNNTYWKVLGCKGNYKDRTDCSNLYSSVILNTYTGEVHLAVGETNITPFVFYKFSLAGSHANGSAELLWDYETGFSQIGDRTESHIAVTRMNVLDVYNWGYSYYGTDKRYHFSAGNGVDEYKTAFSAKSTDIMYQDPDTSSFYSDGQQIGLFALRWKYGDNTTTKYNQWPTLFEYGTSNPHYTWMRVRVHSDIYPYGPTPA